MDEIKVPDLGGFDAVEVIELSVSVGDHVDAEDSILVVETDKATMEIPAPAAGVIKALKVKEGDKVSEGDVIALFESEAQADSVSTETASSSSLPESGSSNEVANNDAIKDESSDVAVTTQSDSGSVAEVAVHVPDLGDFSDVEVIEVSVASGDQVEQEETLLVLETDKAAMEIPAPMAGEVVALHVATGDRVSEGTLIATLKGVVAQASQSASGSVERNSEEKVKVPTSSADTNLDKAKAPERKSGSQTVALSSTAGGSASDSNSVYAGPAVRKLAREFGVSLQDVLSTQGASGPRNRVLQEDIQGYVKRRLNEDAPKANQGMGIEPIPEIDFSRFGETRREPLSRIQKISSQHLHRCWLNIPHVTQFDEIDITELEDFRKTVNKEGTYEIKLTLLPFLVKAVQKVLTEMPRFNASLAPDGDELIIKEYYNIGVAVDTDQGLVVPVLQNVDTKSVLKIASESMHYALQARKGKLKPDSLQGSCFSISSLGSIGGTQFTPIVNGPEVAILGVSKASIKPVWQDDGWLPRLILPIALSYDHRVIDGVLAARFTTRLKQVLEDSRHLLL